MPKCYALASSITQEHDQREFWQSAIECEMARPKGLPKTGGGSRKGIPNKLSGDVRAMILRALDEVGGHAYLVEQAQKNPNAFMSLVGKVLAMQDYGNGGALTRPQHGPVNLSVTFVSPPDRYAEPTTPMIDVTPDCVEPAE